MGKGSSTRKTDHAPFFVDLTSVDIGQAKTRPKKVSARFSTVFIVQYRNEPSELSAFFNTRKPCSKIIDTSRYLGASSSAPCTLNPAYSMLCIDLVYGVLSLGSGMNNKPPLQLGAAPCQQEIYEPFVLN